MEGGWRVGVGWKQSPLFHPSAKLVVCGRVWMVDCLMDSRLDAGCELSLMGTGWELS